MNDDPKILAGRYEVGDLIGRGGMAEVHIGYDTRLGRTVAIKILRADLARDPSFQTRFRREAQAAAGLNHPTIVAVYDTGEDTFVNEGGNPQAVPFIVMEYVEGHTVRDILKGDIAAPIDEAVEIVMGVLTALDYSHHAGLVHRDIKPANVMLTPTGAIKVMDFGIARALADAGQTMTQTQAVVGTAQYLSPEQARGENVDARSDLYSTGCLLFELLTGRPPFIGDSPVSVAYQHVREEAPTPSSFASDVPADLDRVVSRALAKNRDARYSTAQEFLNDLRAVMSGSAVDPSTGAIDLGSAALGAGVAGVAAAGAAAALTPQQLQEQPTQVMNGLGTGAQPGTAIMPAGVAPGTAAWAATGAAGGGASGQLAPRSGGVALAEDEELIPDASRSWKQWLILGGAAAAAVLLIIALFAIARSGGGGGEPELITIPDLTFSTELEARTALEGLDLVPVFTREASEDVDVDRVIRTEPSAGTEVEEGSTVTVVLSSGADVVTVPDVLGMSREDAVERIEEAGLRVGAFDVDHSPDFEADRATRTDPERGEQVARDSVVTLFIASGQVELPDLVGTSEAAARTELANLRLSPDIVDVETDEQRPGTVLSQDPRPGLVPRGSTVTIRVAVEPKLKTVPNVVGQTEGNATNRLQADGFVVAVQTVSSETVSSGRVISQNPSAGAQEPNGATVTIVVSTGPPSPPDPTPGP
ncbi:MAG: serine/threonine protein kinase [Actinobacteria bacterium HGW-Actinobacteria-4]|nr:MAG: serine/threonine protein kinase [Actinobacteria bacterium HGW-Actinobacteria-4]